MFRILSLVRVSFASLSMIVIPSAMLAQAQASPSAAASSALPGPADAKAGKLFAKAMKDFDARKFAVALDGFRKADSQDGNHCVACEMQAYKAATNMQDFKVAREEAALLLEHVTTPEDKAEMHTLAGEACLADGGYRIFEKPFQEADSEFQAALQIHPQMPECLYGDAVALAHLHQYDKSHILFEQYLKAVSPSDFKFARAKLFASQPELARKRTAPEFKVVALDGKTVSMQALAGKVVLLDFWATWCGPCKQALPHLKELVKKFEGQPLVVISVSLDQDEATWKNFVAQNGMTWAQYRDGGFDGPIATAFAVKAIPTTFSIDADGFVQDQQVGDGDISAILEKLIGKAKAAANSNTVAEVH